MKKLSAAAALVALATLVACNNTPLTPGPLPEPEQPITSQQELRDGMRQLWTQHVFWTRLYVVGALADLPDQKASLDRLLKNQVDLGNAVKPFYGEAAGAKLTELLLQHITQAGELIAAAKAGDSAKVGTLKGAWQQNADAIADFLADANPHWPRAELHQMMQMHLDTTLVEVTARLQKDWIADVAAYDEVRAHILMMADALTDGLVAQFPNKISRRGPLTAEATLHLGMRTLWEDHVSWTRLYIIADVGKQPDALATTDRLLQNQLDLGNAIRPYYGDAAADQLTALLREHILGAADVLHAAEAGKTTEVDAAYARWAQNADQIATFLAGANPYLNVDGLKSMMRMHLDQTVLEVTARLEGDYAAEVIAYDHVEQHVLGLGDGLSGAIIQQFPTQFEVH